MAGFGRPLGILRRRSEKNGEGNSAETAGLVGPVLLPALRATGLWNGSDQRVVVPLPEREAGSAAAAPTPAGSGVGAPEGGLPPVARVPEPGRPESPSSRPAWPWPARRHDAIALALAPSRPARRLTAEPRAPERRRRSCVIL